MSEPNLIVPEAMLRLSDPNENFSYKRLCLEMDQQTYHGAALPSGRSLLGLPVIKDGFEHTKSVFNNVVNFSHNEDSGCGAAAPTRRDSIDSLAFIRQFKDNHYDAFEFEFGGLQAI